MSFKFVATSYAFPQFKYPLFTGVRMPAGVAPAIPGHSEDAGPADPACRKAGAPGLHVGHPGLGRAPGAGHAAQSGPVPQPLWCVNF